MAAQNFNQEALTMSNHESPPKLCSGCMETIHAMIDRREQVDYYYCEHFATLALIGLLENRIVHWSLYGQVSPNEAAELLAKSVSLSQMVDEMAAPQVVH
jgi:hypothetical protein